MANKYKIVTSKTAEGLVEKVNELINEGWKPSGSHKVYIVREQLRFSGTQHRDTVVENCFSQTMVAF